jgi:hypothetical protein
MFHLNMFLSTSGGNNIVEQIGHTVILRMSKKLQKRK